MLTPRPVNNEGKIIKVTLRWLRTGSVHASNEMAVEMKGRPQRVQYILGCWPQTSSLSWTAILAISEGQLFNKMLEFDNAATTKTSL